MEQNLFSIIGLLKQAKIREMQETNTEILHSSPEYAYWKNKLNEDSDCKQYKRFKKVKNDHKRLCPNRSDFKSHSKWYGEVGQYYTYKDHLYNIAGNVRKSAQNNRVYCAASRKYKVLFESEKSANNFIKYNSDDIREQNGYAPIRSYYCPICGGWHVTSQPEDHTIEDDHMCHAEYVLMAVRKMHTENEKRKLIAKQETIKTNQTNECQSSDANYQKLILLHNDFIGYYSAKNFKSAIETYDELVSFVKENEIDKIYSSKVENVLKNAKRAFIKLAIEQDDLTELYNYDCLDHDDYVKVLMLVNIRRQIITFDNELANGNIDKCREIYESISGIQDIEFIPSANKMVKKFLDRASQVFASIQTTDAQMRDYLSSCIDRYIAAYQIGDEYKCQQIQFELTMCDVDGFGSTIKDVYYNALNLMQGRLSTAC